MYILSIETSTNVCSVALSGNKGVIFQEIDINGPSHASILGLFVEEALLELKKLHASPDAVAVSSGPGSYTGLRIGVSLAKGICYGLDIPLIALDTLVVMAQSIKDKADADSLLCPMIDARRMEVYSAIFDTQLNPVRQVRADVVDENTYTSFLNEHKVIFFGNGSDKCKQVINHPNAQFISDIYPSATHMWALAMEAYQQSEFADLAYYEPFYLKDFVATTPKNKVLSQ